MFASYRSSLIEAQIAGTAIASSVTQTSLLPSAAIYTLPANQIMRAGQKFRIEASGQISTVATTPGTLQFFVMFGSIAVAQSVALPLNIVAKVNVPWQLEWDLTCRTIGNSTVATIMHQGMWVSEAVIGSPLPSAGGAGTAMLSQGAAPTVGAGFNSTIAMTVDLQAQFSVNNASASIQLFQYTLESVN